MGVAPTVRSRSPVGGIRSISNRGHNGEKHREVLRHLARRLGYNVAQEVNIMAGNSVVRARIDERTKREAAAALKKIGLTLSDAFRLLLVRVAAEKALPFEPLNPNAETVAAMEAARRGELVKAGKPDKLLRSLNAGD